MIYLDQHLELKFFDMHFNCGVKLYDVDPKAIAIRVTSVKVKSSLSSMDSDLEAFSHNPTDGSFAPLPFQARAFTNYLNQRFLSY